MAPQHDDARSSRGSSPCRDGSPDRASASSASSRDDAQRNYGRVFGPPIEFVPSHLWRWRQSYRRVSLMDYEDVEAAYPFLCSCIEEPDIAARVEELVIGNELLPHDGRFSLLNVRPESRQALSARQGTHEALVSHVRGLGLSKKATEQLVWALDWKKRVFAKENPSREETEGEDRDWDDNRGNNIRFALAAAVVLLSLCKNIATVRIDNIDRSRYRWEALVEFLFKCNYGKVKSGTEQGDRLPMQNVRQVMVNPSGSRWYFRTEMTYLDVRLWDVFRCFHRLPALESVDVVGCKIHKDDSDLWLLPPACSGFTKLRLNRVNLPDDMVCGMVRSARRLEEFTLYCGGFHNSDGSCIVLRRKTLGMCLLQHRHTLRVLDLDIEVSEGDSDSEGSDVDDMYEEMKEFGVRWYELDEAISSGPPYQLPDTRDDGVRGIGSLQDFEALTHLSINPISLLEDSAIRRSKAARPDVRLIDILPPNLEYFCMYDYRKGRSQWLDDQVGDLMSRMAEKLPSLKEVRGYETRVKEPRKEDLAREGAGSDDEGDGGADGADDDQSDVSYDFMFWRQPKEDWDWVKWEDQTA